VSKMAKLVKVHWYLKSDQSAREAIGKYRQKYGNGPLFRQFVIAVSLAGIGGVMLVFGNKF